MEITLKFDNISEINESKNWFRNKYNNDEYVKNKKDFYYTNKNIISQKYFDEYLRNEIINDFIGEKLMIDPNMLLFAVKSLYFNIYNVLYEIYKTMDIVETEIISENMNIEENAEQITESTFTMPNMNKIMLMI